MRQATITLEKAHDVRRLCSCTKCGQIGDDRHMPLVDGRPMHGFCALDVLGVGGIAALPAAELGKVTLGEIGSKNMRAIMDHLG